MKLNASGKEEYWSKHVFICNGLLIVFVKKRLLVIFINSQSSRKNSHTKTKKSPQLPCHQRFTPKQTKLKNRLTPMINYLLLHHKCHPAAPCQPKRFKSFKNLNVTATISQQQVVVKGGPQCMRQRLRPHEMTGDL